jgi:hypothetical protein
MSIKIWPNPKISRHNIYTSRDVRASENNALHFISMICFIAASKNDKLTFQKLRAIDSNFVAVGQTI